MISVAPGALPDAAVLSVPPLTRFLKRVSAAVRIEGEVEVLLASDAELRRLNRQFRGKNKATDVLSFPAEAVPGLPAGSQHAGDLAISLDTAARQAAEHGHTLATEVRVLLLHGMLHLAGMDHETDQGEMRKRETDLRRELRLPSSLIARSLPSPGLEQTSADARPVRPKASGATKEAAGSRATPEIKRGSRR